MCFLRILNRCAITAIFLSFEIRDPTGDTRVFIAFFFSLEVKKNTGAEA